MDRTRGDKGKAKNFRWSKVMSDILLNILADEALKGNKPSSTFKADSFEKVAKAIKERFDVECTADNVASHLKTIKSNRKIISTLREKSSFGWNEELKMIVVDDNVFTEEIMAHPSHEKFLNKPVDKYEQMQLVAENDMATGSFAKSFNDINLAASIEINSTPGDEYEMDSEEVTRSKEVSSSNTRSTKRSHHKRRCEDDSNPSIDNLADQVKQVAMAIQSLNEDPTQKWLTEFYEQVMKVEGFDRITLSHVFDYLVLNEMIAKSFMIKSDDLKQLWIQNFVDLRRSGGN